MGAANSSLALLKQAQVFIAEACADRMGRHSKVAKLEVRAKTTAQFNGLRARPTG